MTANGWLMVPLGSLLTRVKEEVDLQDDVIYKQTTVRLWNKGVILRGEQLGREIKTKRQFRIHSGQLVLSRIDVRNGAIGLVPPELDGAIISNDFWTYEIDQGQLAPKFLALCVTTPSFQDEANRASSGTTHRIRAEEEGFLQINVPLPPLTEQRRIVARIEELAAKIEEARGLRRQAVEEAKVLVNASARRLLSGVNVEETELRHWLAPNRDGIQTGPFGAQLGTQDFVDLGIPLLTIGNVQYGGLELSDLKYVSEEKAKQLGRFVAREGDILFARMGTVGRCCVVPQEADGWLFNYHIIRVALDKSRVTPRYIHWTIRASPDVESYLSGTIRGATRQGVNSKIVGALPCRVPAMSEQRRIVAYLDELQAKADAVKRLQAETSAELEALLPSVLDRAFKGEL
jgi:type I restriction enzyme, S subunit